MGTLWFGGKIYTLDKEGSRVEAVFVENGFIIETGCYKDLANKYKTDIKKMYDLKGKTMIPGLVDSHVHLIGHGEKLSSLDFSLTTSTNQMIEMIKGRVKNSKLGSWIIGEGWNENQLEDQRIIHKAEIDQIAPDHPVLLRRVCRHAVIANSKALELANITGDTTDPIGGVIVKDEKNEPTGYLLDQAQELLLSIAPSPTQKELEHSLEAAIRDCYQKGLVGAHTEDLSYFGSLDQTLGAFYHVLNKRLKFRAHLLINHQIVDEFHQKERGIGSNGEFGAMKIFADGALGGRTALLSFPYHDAPDTTGIAMHSKAELAALIAKARDYRMEVAIHVIGDLAFEWALDALCTHPPQEGQHDRLIHGQVLRKDLLARAKQLPIIIDIQPRFVASDFPWVIERIGQERMDMCYAWKTLLQEGIHCAGGSDAPIESIDPLLGIHAAVTRTSLYGNSGDSYYPEQKLSVYEAVELYTKGSAYAIHHSQDRGMIRQGHTADFTVFDQDIFEIEPDELLHTKVMLTVIDDDIVYKYEEQKSV